MSRVVGDNCPNNLWSNNSSERKCIGHLVLLGSMTSFSEHCNISRTRPRPKIETMTRNQIMARGVADANRYETAQADST